MLPDGPQSAWTWHADPCVGLGLSTAASLPETPPRSEMPPSDRPASAPPPPPLPPATEPPLPMPPLPAPPLPVPPLPIPPLPAPPSSIVPLPPELAPVPSVAPPAPALPPPPASIPPVATSDAASLRCNEAPFEPHATMNVTAARYRNRRCGNAIDSNHTRLDARRTTVGIVVVTAATVGLPTYCRVGVVVPSRRAATGNSVAIASAGFSGQDAFVGGADEAVLASDVPNARAAERTWRANSLSTVDAAVRSRACAAVACPNSCERKGNE